MFNKITKQIQFGRDTVTLETGQIARQATAAVMVRIGDTEVLVTVVGKKEADPSKNFFPLTVNYQEKTYAAGRIPGGFFKREGRPSEKETLTCRLIDTRAAPIGPPNGIPEMDRAAEVPIRAAISGSWFLSADMTVATTCTSFMKPLGNSGRMGRSIRRQVRVSFSLGRPSRLKKPPGIRPAA